MSNVKEVVSEALVAANKAAVEEFARYGNKDSYPCGFAWLVVNGVKLNSKVGKEFAALGFRKGYGKGAGIELWNPSGLMVQNVDIKLVGAQAAAEVLREAGYDASAGSRWD